ncbi:FAD-binding protein [Nocardia abscessus]|uniref:FAD-binding protein n=1 Tax=Nocardia abscessus TaxID=120957 RepID=UPI0002F9FFB2|nr:FAD-binding protein [Nocardia abscessus]MCC3333451.1 FAD-binding protein [Nocardia abscessus]
MSPPEVPIDEFATDFGGLRRAVPRAVHRMPSAFPSALLGSGRQLTLRGAGHSCDGQTVTEGDLLVTYVPGTADRQVRDLGDGLIEVPAGMSWYDLERYLNRRGRAFPVLTDYLHLSVGGTISVGGAGMNSARYGMQVDHVERIQLIDGTGTSRWCSRTDHAELFRFALGGLGTVGLIERAVLRTVAYHRYTHVHRTQHATLTELIDHTERIAQRDDVDVFCAYPHPGVSFSITGWSGSVPKRCGDKNCRIVSDLPFMGRYNATRTAAPPPDHVRLWTDYVVPAGRLAPMLAAVEAQRQRAPLSRHTMLYLLILRRPSDATAFAFTPVGSAPVSIGLGLYTSVPRDPATTAATRRLFRDLLELCCELGGRPYLYGVNDLDDLLAARLYGTDLDRLAQLRSSHQLEHVNAHLPLVRAARPT